MTPPPRPAPGRRAAPPVATHDGIIVLGAPRSGTTLLRRLLDAHPRVACPPETNVLSACGRFLRSERIADGVRVGAVEGLGFAGFPREEVLGRLRELAFGFHRDYARRQGKPRWASKTAFDAFYLDEIEALCGDHAAFICIHRHGVDVACSLRELSDKNGGYLRELHDYVVRHPLVLEAFAHAWVDLARALAAFAQRHPRNALVVRYEDLAAAPDVTMTRIMAFLGETWSSELVAQALGRRDDVGLGDWKTYGRPTIDTSSVGRRRQLSRDTLGRLGAICNPTLRACGYAPIAVDEEADGETAQRRYQLGLQLQGLRKGPPPDGGTSG